VVSGKLLADDDKKTGANGRGADQRTTMFSDNMADRATRFDTLRTSNGQTMQSRGVSIM